MIFERHERDFVGAKPHGGFNIKPIVALFYL